MRGAENQGCPAGSGGEKTAAVGVLRGCASLRLFSELKRRGLTFGVWEQKGLPMHTCVCTSAAACRGRVYYHRVSSETTHAGAQGKRERA